MEPLVPPAGESFNSYLESATETEIQVMSVPRWLQICGINSYNGSNNLVLGLTSFGRTSTLLRTEIIPALLLEL